MTMHITAVKTTRLRESWANADRRYERKFQVDEVDRSTVETVVRHHPAIFSEIYHQRWVNNIYFDTYSLENYEDNVSGFSEHRLKVRIRWYGNLHGQVRHPKLELKISRSWLNWKMNFTLPAFVLDSDLSAAGMRELLRSSDLPKQLQHELLGMSPTLVNRYHRQYFASRGRAFRFTIDSDLGFYDLNRRGGPVLHRWWDPDYVVLELKYAEDTDSEAHSITQHLPFRLTRSSKYVTGVDAIRRGQVPGSRQILRRRSHRSALQRPPNRRAKRDSRGD